MIFLLLFLIVLKKKQVNLLKKYFFYPGVELNKFDFKKVKKFIPIKGKPVIGYIGAVTEVLI